MPSIQAVQKMYYIAARLFWPFASRSKIELELELSGHFYANLWITFGVTGSGIRGNLGCLNRKGATACVTLDSILQYNHQQGSLLPHNVKGLDSPVALQVWYLPLAAQHEVWLTEILDQLWVWWAMMAERIWKTRLWHGKHDRWGMLPSEAHISALQPHILPQVICLTLKYYYCNKVRFGSFSVNHALSCLHSRDLSNKQCSTSKTVFMPRRKFLL